MCVDSEWIPIECLTNNTHFENIYHKFWNLGLDNSFACSKLCSLSIFTCSLEH
jgi:hypothetical protein